MLRVCFNCYGNYTTDRVFQWDQNHTLHIVGVDLTYAPAVHFCNKKSTEAIVVQSKKVADGFTAPIPNILLQEEYNIIAYVHIYDINEENAKTVEIINIPLVKRVKPSEYQFEDNVEVMSFERLETDIVDFIAKMEGEFEDYTSDTDAKYNAFTTESTNNYTNFTNKVVKDYEYLKDETQSATGAKSGKVVAITDSRASGLPKISAFGKSVQDTYSGKNLLENTAITQIFNGITFTVNEDKSVTASGTAISTASATCYLNRDLKLPNGTYILSGRYSDKFAITIHRTFNDGTENYSNTLTKDNLEFSIDDNVNKVDLYLYIQAGTPLSNATIYPMIRKATITDDTFEPFVGGEASPNPSYPQDITSVADDKSLVVKSVGKNLLKNTGTSTTNNGITFTVNEDKSVTVNGTATAQSDFYIANLPNLPNGDLILSGCPSGGNFSTYSLHYSNMVDKAYVDKGDSIVFNKFDYETYPKCKVMISIANGTVCNNLVFKPMIRHASIEDDTYEPYVSTEATLTLTDRLRGIPVASGGNYVDEDGQSWICNSIEKYADGTGKFIKRVGTYIFYDSNSGAWGFVPSNNCFTFGLLGGQILRPVDNNTRASLFCTHFKSKTPKEVASGITGISVDKYGTISIYNGMTDLTTWKEWLADNIITLVFPLAEYEETDLTAEELEELEKLQTFEPYTTIYTDDIGEVEVAYFKNNLNGEYMDEHIHDDRYYRKDETYKKSETYSRAEIEVVVEICDGKLKDIIDEELADKSDKGHNHDDRYYTETETDQLIETQIRALQTMVFDDMANKSDNGHTHDDRYYTKNYVDGLLETKAESNHGHDERYYLKNEVYTKDEIGVIIAELRAMISS